MRCVPKSRSQFIANGGRRFSQTMNLEVLTPSESRLSEIAEQIVGGKLDGQKLLKQCLGRAIEMGKLFSEAKSLCPHGEFESWCVSKTGYTIRSAQLYMQASKAKNFSPLSLEDATCKVIELQREAKKRAAKESGKELHITESNSEDSVFTCLDDVLKTGRKYGTIYMDPPWKYGNQGTRAATDNHYSTMAVEDICKLDIGALAAEKSHLHLWTTNGFLFECPKLFAAWGFEFKSSFVWVKDNMGIGNYWRNSHEILLLGVRGGQTALSKSEMSWILHPRGEHSSKPDKIRESIERLSPGPRFEMFGRSPVKGWDVCGDQITML